MLLEVLKRKNVNCEKNKVINLSTIVFDAMEDN